MTVEIDHLWNKHVAELRSAEQRNGRLGFRDRVRGVDYLPLGQWLLAMEHCQNGHTWQNLGENHWPCPSDNCDYCARCGVEHHD